MPFSGLPAARRSAARLQAVIGGIAHHMGERVLDQVEHLAVELGLGAVHLELDLLAELGRQVAHDARQLLPGVADRLHARLHDAFLQLGGDVGEPLQRHLEFGVLVPAHDLEELVAGEHQLGDHGHQVFERIDVDADRLVGDLASASSSSSPLGIFGRGRGLRLVPAPRHRARRFAERALELVERDFARTKRPLQRLRTSVPASVRPAPAAARGTCCAICSSSTDQVGVVAFRLALVRFELAEHVLDAVDGEQDQRDGLAGDRHAVAELAHQGFGGVRQRFQPRQAEEAAGALDGVDEAEDVVENLGVVRLLLETHELDVDHVEAFVRLGQELPQQVVHRSSLCSGERWPPDQFRPSRLSVASRRLISVAAGSHSSPLTDVNAAR